MNRYVYRPIESMQPHGPYRAGPKHDTEIDFAEVALARQIRRARTLKTALLSAFVVLCVSPCAWMAWRGAVASARERARRAARQLTVDEKVELDRALDEADRVLDERSAHFLAATRSDALALLEPSGEACGEAPGAPTTDASRTWIENGTIDGRYSPHWGYTMRPTAGGDVSLEAARLFGGADEVAAARATVSLVREREARGEAERGDLKTLQQIANGAVLAHAVGVIVVVDRFVRPTLLRGDEYDPGHIVGRAYLYHFGHESVVCVGDVDARNSDAVDVNYYATAGTDGDKAFAARGVLERELDVELRRAIAGGLRATAR